MTESPTQRAERADRMLERCRESGNVRLSHLEGLRNDLRAVANKYDDLEAQLKLQAGALPLYPFGEWFDHQMREQDLGAADIAAQANHLLTAALRVVLAERTWGTDAVPEDSEYDAREAFALAARVYVRAIDQMPERERPPGWDLTDTEDLRAQVARLTEMQTWLRAMNDRNNRVIEVFVKHHQEYPMPEDARKAVLAAMDGYGVPEFPGHPGSRWCDAAGDEWVLGDDGRMNVVGCTLDPNNVAETYGPLTRAGGKF